MKTIKEIMITILACMTLIGCTYIINERLSENTDSIILMEERLKKLESTLFMQKVMLEEVYDRLMRIF